VVCDFTVAHRTDARLVRLSEGTVASYRGSRHKQGVDLMGDAGGVRARSTLSLRMLDLISR
jgi:hypothetical protein